MTWSERLRPIVGWCVLVVSVLSLLPLKLEVVRIAFPALLILSWFILPADAKKQTLWLLGPFLVAGLAVAVIGLPGLPGRQTDAYGLAAIVVWVAAASVVASLKSRYARK